MTSESRLRREAERREAERRAQEDGSDLVTGNEIDPADQEALVHELRVHQIELELQNEELRRTQDVLEQTKAEFVDLYDEAPVGYASLDASAVIRRANRQLATMLGTEQSRLVGRPLSGFLARHSQDAFMRRFGALFREPFGKSIDVTVPAGDGDAAERVLQITAKRSDESAGGKAAHGSDGNGRESDDDDRVRLRIATVDVTERRQAEARVRELLAQKELLFRELRHRTSNNYQIVLAMLSLQSDLLGDERVSDALAQAMSRIEAMVLVQQSLVDTEADARTELGTYLSELVERIVSAVDPDHRVTIVKRFARCHTDADIASSVGLIVNELATNAWKHAFAARGGGTLEVTLDQGADDWVLAVSDDGRAGAPSAHGEPEQRHGLGQTLVEALASQLGGTFRRDTTAGGTRCILRLPRSAALEPDA